MDPNTSISGNNTDNSYQQNFPINSPRKTEISDIISTVLILISAPLLAVLLSVFVFRTYQVDGPSMLTTLHNKDRLIINKLPKTASSITGKKYIPKRYDIVVFHHSGQFDGSGVDQKQIIKRVIALPGERIVIKDGVATVYNQSKPQGFLVDKDGPESSVIESTEGNIDQTIKEGEVFVMGDNRANSLDSRVLGSIKSEDIVGRLVLRIYPFKDWKSF